MCEGGTHLKTNLYHKRKVNAVVQISEPEEVGEPVGDVEGTELLVAQVQKSQDTDVVLIASVKINDTRFCFRTNSLNGGVNLLHLCWML